MQKLNAKKLAISLFFGVVYWFIGLIIIRVWGQYFNAENKLFPILLYALIVPFNSLLFIIPVRLANLFNSADRPESYDAIVQVSLVGCFLDVICVNFIPSIYDQPAPIMALGLAWLLWGVGTGLLIGYAGKDLNIANPKGGI